MPRFPARGGKRGSRPPKDAVYRDQTQYVDAVGAALDLLRALGWMVRHGVGWPGCPGEKVDHLAAGPAGLFVIVDEHSANKAPTRASDAAGAPWHASFDQAREAADALALAFPDVPVIPVVCFVQTRDVRLSSDEALLCSPSNILSLLTEQPAQVDAAGVQHLARSLSSELMTAVQPAGPVVPGPRSPAPPERTGAADAAREAERLASAAAAREEAERLAREQAEREAAEQAAREAAEQKAREQAAREAAERAEAERLTREQAEREAAEQAAREAAEQEAREQAARAAAARAEAERLAREQAEREAAEQAAREAAEQEAREQAERAAAERAEAERLDRAQAERAAAEQAAREAAEQKAREQAAREAAERAEAERLAREQAEREAAEQAAREAAEQKAREQAEREAAEQAAREAAEREAAEQRAREQAEREAAEQAAREAAEREAAEQKAREQAEREAAEQAAREAAEQEAREQAAREAARAEAARIQAEQKARAKADRSARAEAEQNASPRRRREQRARPAGERRETTGHGWARNLRHAALGLVLLGVIAVAVALLLPRFNDAIDTAKGALEKRTPVAFDSTITVRNSIYHPAMDLTAGGVTRAGAKGELFAIRLRVDNQGDEAWSGKLWSRLTLVDKVGYSHAPVTARTALGDALPERLRVPAGASVEGYVYFRVPGGRDLKELQYDLSPEDEDALVWRTTEALSQG